MGAQRARFSPARGARGVVSRHVAGGGIHQAYGLAPRAAPPIPPYPEVPRPRPVRRQGRRSRRAAIVRPFTAGGWGPRWFAGEWGGRKTILRAERGARRPGPCSAQAPVAEAGWPDATTVSGPRPA